MTIPEREFGQLEQQVKRLDEDMRRVVASLDSIKNSIRYIIFFMVLMFADAATTNPWTKSLLALIFNVTN